MSIRQVDQQGFARVQLHLGQERSSTRL